MQATSALRHAYEGLSGSSCIYAITKCCEVDIGSQLLRIMMSVFIQLLI